MGIQRPGYDHPAGKHAGDCAIAVPTNIVLWRFKDMDKTTWLAGNHVSHCALWLPPKLYHTFMKVTELFQTRKFSG